MEGYINFIYQATDKAIFFNTHTHIYIYIYIIYPLWMKHERKLWTVRKVYLPTFKKEYFKFLSV